MWALIFFSLFVQAEVKTPRVVGVRGQAQVQTARESKLRAAKAGDLLRETAILETGDLSEIRLALDSARELVLEGGTRVVIPGISWENGAAPVIQLQKGRLRWKSKESGGVELRTVIFETKPPSGDFVFVMEAGKARTEVWSLQGDLTWHALGDEENSVTVKPQHKSAFQGVLEEGEVAFDILLKGHRIPRGEMQKPTALSETELRVYLDEEKRQQEETRKREEKARRQRKADEKAGAICASPRARFNECAWVCVGNPKDSKKCRLDRASVKCVRSRCDANGRWSDAKELLPEEATKCQAAPLVAPCDY